MTNVLPPTSTSVTQMPIVPTLPVTMNVTALTVSPVMATKITVLISMNVLMVLMTALNLEETVLTSLAAGNVNVSLVLKTRQLIQLYQAVTVLISTSVVLL